MLFHQINLLLLGVKEYSCLLVMWLTWMKPLHLVTIVTSLRSTATVGAHLTMVSLWVVLGLFFWGHLQLEWERYILCELSNIYTSWCHIVIWPCNELYSVRCTMWHYALSWAIILFCTVQGRQGKGSIYVWASGNGGEYNDSCATDGYSSSIYTISIGSAAGDGTQSYYDEECSGKMAVAFVDNPYGDMRHVVRCSLQCNIFISIRIPCDKLWVQTYSKFGAWYDIFWVCETFVLDIFPIQTTTTLNGSCVNNFSGTSAACPLASGAIALALEVKWVSLIKLSLGC